ncbi:hypothetical protein NYZ34_19860, partial [Acinetobacter baumannii]|nr:hypothetical protein [Acinetobacter baumannii]
MAAFDTAGVMQTMEAVTAKINELTEIAIDESWQEFMAEATAKKRGALESMHALLGDLQKRAAEAAELERLRREKAEEEQRDRDAKIAAEAAERARREAEEKAKAEAAEAARKIAEAAAAAKAQAEAAA